MECLRPRGWEDISYLDRKQVKAAGVHNKYNQMIIIIYNLNV